MFLNVPVFLLLAALSLGGIALGDSPYIRWNPLVLAATHFFTLGVIASAMLGAMMQILPVATHIHVLLPRITSAVTHSCLTLGTLSLGWGFLNTSPTFHGAAVVLLGLAFTVFLIAVAGGLIRDGRHRSPGSREILVAVRLALAGLVITLVFGLFMAGLRATFWSPVAAPYNLWMHGLPDLHALWGLAGWVGLLVIGISYQVIPIFQATEIYPRHMTDTLTPVLFLLLVALTVAVLRQPLSDSGLWLRLLPAALLALGYLWYGATTTRLLWTRKRPAPEPTTWFWHISMLALMLAALLGVLSPLLIAKGATDDTIEILLGTLLIPGFAVSAVNGMLYKIVPFLLWHNAQRRAPVALSFMPRVRQFIAERDALRQFAAHLGAVTLLSAACFMPALLLPAALLLAVSATLLTWNLARALHLYARTCRRIKDAPHAPPPAQSP